MKPEIFTIRSATTQDIQKLRDDGVIIQKLRDDGVIIFKGAEKVHAESKMLEPEEVRRQRVERLSRRCKIEEGYG